MPPLDPEAYWRSTWRAPVARLARQDDRGHISLRVDAAMRQLGTGFAYDIFDHRFVPSPPSLPGLAGEPDICLVLADAVGDRFAVAECERAATKALAVHDLLHTALCDLVIRATSGRRDVNAITRWIMGDDDEPPTG